MPPERIALLFPLVLVVVLASGLLMRLRLPRLVVRFALIDPGARPPVARRAVGTPPATPAVARGRNEGSARRPPAVIPRACEVRLARDMHAWRRRRRETLEVAS